MSAVVRMRVRDFQDHGDARLVLAEKGGKQRRLLAPHVVRDHVREYLAAHLQRADAANQPLFQSVPGRTAELSGKPLDRSAVLAIVKRRCREVGLPPSICNHSFRATGITLYQEGGGDIETAARLAGHADTRTTQLYNRHERSVTGAELERIQLWTAVPTAVLQPFPRQTVRDLLGITRALYRAERHTDLPLVEERCRKLTEVGSQCQLAVKLAKSGAGTASAGPRCVVWRKPQRP